MLEEITDVETRRYRVAVEGTSIIGYMGVMLVLDELHVNTIGTLPGHESRGVATSLMDDAWAHAKERSIARATLEVAVIQYERARALYARYGVPSRGDPCKNYYERIGEDALVLWADLD